MVELARALLSHGGRAEGLLERVAPLVELRKKLKSSGTRSLDAERDALKAAELRVEDAHAQVRAAPFFPVLSPSSGRAVDRATDGTEHPAPPNDRARGRRLDWAALLKRTHSIEVLVCPTCARSVHNPPYRRPHLTHSPTRPPRSSPGHPHLR
jgi:hypothetical protein